MNFIFFNKFPINGTFLAPPLYGTKWARVKQEQKLKKFLVETNLYSNEENEKLSAALSR